MCTSIGQRVNSRCRTHGGVAAQSSTHHAKDPDVIDCAQSLDAVLVTLNGDFADIINYPPIQYGGIIALQVRNHPESLPAIVMRLLTYLREHPESKHWAGKLFLVETHRIRIKEE
jgi:predicted nuclease of predicted toxin-antitoxin system